MAKKRIIAHFMHENERGAATNVMKDFTVTEGFVIGEIDEEKIKELSDQGLIIQDLEAERPLHKAIPRKPRLGRRTRRASVRMPGIRAPRAEVKKPDFYIIDFKGPLLEEWRNDLSNLKVQLMEAIGPNRYTSHLSHEQIVALHDLPFISKVRLYEEDKDALPFLETAAEIPPDTGARSMVTFDIRLRKEDDLNKTVQWLKDKGVDIAGAKGRKIRLNLFEDSIVPDEISALPEVYSVEEFIPPKLHNDRARILLGIDSDPNEALGTGITQTGNGQIIAVADTGLDKNHPDFQGRISGCVALGRLNDSSDPNGHGTHVAGSIAGDGSSSGGSIKGTAPEAQLFFQSIMDAQGGLGGLPFDLKDLFAEAYNAGARIHNNSWGADTRSRYTINSIEVDEFVYENKDMLIIISAGNEGTAASPINSDPGFVDWLSINSPASCKNALIVGASRTDRKSGGYSNLTYGQAWPGDFTEDPIAAEKVSGNHQALAAFSSRGPCDDRRIKPDVVVPGTDILSTKSSQAPLRNFWGIFPDHNNRYAYMGGTSMAAPIVAGCAALVREYYDTGHNHKPSAALLKATLINSTRKLSAADAVADFPNLPNFHQGFGCIFIPWAIPNPSVPDLKLNFVDQGTNNFQDFTYTGQRLRYLLKVEKDFPLRICLVWTDPPARALQNNLNLFVEDPTGKKWIGNKDLPMSLNIPDPENNVEVIRIENPKPGNYTIQITASNLLKTDGQDFALVVTGKIKSNLTRI